MPSALQGRRVALAEGRQLEELAQLLEQEGAEVIRCPMIAIQDAPDAAAVGFWLDDLVAGRFAYVVLMTGEALRRLLGFAEKTSRQDVVISTLAKTKIVTRGPKPVKALKEIGLVPHLIAQAPTTEGIIATLRNEPLSGQIVGYTLFGSPNPTIEAYLRECGAIGRPVLSYVYSPSSDGERVAELIGRMARGEIDLLMITSTPQVERLFEVAQERHLEALLTEGLMRTRVAAVGPVAAQSLQQHGAKVDIQPEQGFVMKNLVQYAKRAFDHGNAS
jgi:uroporphyrinogen-III synthase